MNKINYILIIALLIVSCSSDTSNNLAISFVQNGKLIQPTNGTITLSKTDFNIVFNAIKTPFDVMVNASFNDNLYNIATNPESLISQKQFKETATIAEALFNEDKSMYVSQGSTSVWYYESKDNHKFNDVEIQNGNYKCTRTIKNFFNLDTDNSFEISKINKPIYVVFLAAKNNGDVTDLTELQRVYLKIEWKGSSKNELVEDKKPSFEDVINSINLKETPLIESTNFESFIDESDYDDVNVKALKLEQIFPDFYNEPRNYWAVRNYRLQLSENFHSIVITIRRGDHEMESVLVNYDLEGQIIDHKIVSYDEIAEGMQQTTSKIENNQITITSKTYLEETIEETYFFKIDDIGKINKVELIDSVLNQLNIKKEDCLEKFIIEEEITYLETIIFIPKITEQEEDRFTLDAHLVLVNNTNGEIKSRFTKKECWFSDALKLDRIELNYQPYKIAENSKIIGIEVEYFGSSRVNPYTSKQLSLFLREEGDLRRILTDFEIYKHTEEINGDGNSTSFENNKSITTVIDSEKDFYDIKVTNTTTETESKDYVEIKLNKSITVEYLQYKNGMYSATAKSNE